MCLLLKLKFNKYGGEQEIQKNKLRESLTLFGASTIEMQKAKALDMLRPIFDRELIKLKHQELILKNRETNKTLTLLTKKIKDKFITKYSKVEVLNTAWKRLFFDLHHISVKNNDHKMTSIFEEINKVPKSVRKAVLKYYMKKCD